MKTVLLSSDTVAMENNDIESNNIILAVAYHTDTLLQSD